MKRVFDEFKRFRSEATEAMRVQNYHDDEQYKMACGWLQGLAPEVRPAEDFEASLAYAKDKYSFAVATFDLLKKKAEWAVGVAATLTAGTIAFSDKIGVNFIFLVPTLTLWFFTLYLVIKLLSPDDIPTPMEASEVVDKDMAKVNSAVWQAASYHCAVKGFEFVIGYKSNQFVVAAKSFAIGLFLFGLAKLGVEIMLLFR